MAAVEILVIGNELLDGATQDTNTFWLCRQVTALGSTVRHAALVRDDPEAIAAAVRAACARGATLLLIAGGLGPTDDDRTLEGVALAAAMPLVEQDTARAMVAARYAGLYARGAVAFAELTPQRLKMAMLPQGADAIENPVGAAPGVHLRIGTTDIVCLPGVPAELKAIFTGPLQPLLTAVLGAGVAREREFNVRLSDESAMAEALRDVAARFPQVYVKSHARSFDGETKIRVTLSARGVDADTVERHLDAAAQALRARLPTD